MLCLNPFVRDPIGRIFKAALLSGNPDLAVQGIPFPCGQCLPCRINKRRLWKQRLLLENMFHDQSAFVTLTYSEENLPASGSLDKRACQLFLKRLRKLYEPKRLRYYLCGEYGTNLHRPHYHAIIFGLSHLDSAVVEQAWPFGFVLVGECNEFTIQYVAGYVTKKFVKKGDSLVKEFTLCSRRPGLGFYAIDKLSKLIQDPQYSYLFQGDSKIPDGLRHGKSFLPFDRYFKYKLEKALDTDADSTTYIREMMARYFMSLKSHPESSQPLVDSLLDESAQRNLQIKARFKIFSKRGDL